ncbi:MAG TPA: kelch repeat-containing protein [Acidimicrobiales bacterium]|jgi:hypothetical protein|nr:kelch repeat-containing protein [Acidimicrobiales bacterium]
MTRLRLFAASCGLAIASAVGILAGTAIATSPAAPTLRWSTPAPATSPGPLAYAAAAYDPDTSPPSLVLFGGSSNGTISGSTWVWDGTTWTQYTLNQPPARDLASMAFDPKLNQLILFGGRSSDGVLLNDTWAWNGQSWCSLSSGVGNCAASRSSPPPPREGAALSYDPDGNLVLFGGTGYSGTTSGGTAINQSSQVGGADKTLSDTWLWKGASAGWVQATVAGPSARSGAAMAYDSATGSTVLFGGESTTTSSSPQLLGDTWIWNGTAWSQAKPAKAPAARYNSVLAYDPTLAGPLLLQGEGAAGVTDDIWLWAGGTWTQATVQTSAKPRQGAAAGYDLAHSDLVVFGGSTGGGQTVSDTGLISVLAGQKSPSTTTTIAPAHRSTTTTTRPGGPSGHGTALPTSHSKSPPTTRPGHRPGPRTSATTVAATTGRPASLQASARNVRQGSVVRLSGTGFAPGAQVTITFHSAPALLGSAVANGQGDFLTDVEVPAHAAPGWHHIEAAGQSADGRPATLSASVFVMGAAHKGIPTRTRWFLLGLALLIPVATYLVMTAAGVRRRRFASSAADAA